MECEFGNKSKAFKEGIKFIVDEEDYENYVKPYKFTLCNGYVRISNTTDMKYLQRWLLNVEDKSKEVDHINRNPLDNRRCNLRVCSKQENMMNKDKTKKNTSGFKCVHWRHDVAKYCALFRYKKTKYYAGTYDDPKEAYEAYMKKLKEVSNSSEFILKTESNHKEYNQSLKKIIDSPLCIKIAL